VAFKYLYCGGYAFAVGLTYMVPVQIGWQLYPKNLGTVSGVVIGGFGLGNIIFSKVSTHVVNPTNAHLIEIELPDGQVVSCFPESVSLLVPHMLRVLFFGFFGVILLSLVLIKIPETQSFENASTNFTSLDS
jgi:hypothetical protein